MKVMDGNEQELEEAYLEMPDTRSEILLQCYNAIAAVDTAPHIVTGKQIGRAHV